jgi:acetate---CoA ligase (ADP-forming)
VGLLASRAQLDKLFGARRVAVIGASSRRADATGNRVIRNLRAAAYDGEIHVVNPSGDRIEGIQSVRGIAALQQVDVAVITLPPAAVAQVVEELEAARCPVAVVLSVGVSDAHLERLMAVHNRGTTVVHGPNCMGLLNVSQNLPLWAEDGVLTDLPAGSISLVSQSGSGAIFVARSISDAGFSKVVSTGNETGLTTADYISWLAHDRDTTTIGVVIESIRNANTFISAVQKAHAAGKKIVALKVGRTERGAAATTAHTGALLSNDAAYAALFKRIGVPLVEDYDELASALQVLAALGDRTIAGDKVGVITISGGQAALAADLAELARVSIPELAAETRGELSRVFPGAVLNNPFDVGGSFEHGDFAQAVEALGADPNLDAVMVILDAQSSLNRFELEFEDHYFAAARAAQSRVPVIVASSSSLTIHERFQGLGKRVPIIRGIRNALVAIRCAATRSGAPTEARPADLPDERTLEMLRSTLQSENGALSRALTDRILRAYGFPFVQSAVVTNVDDAACWAASAGYPVVLKVSSPDIAHRSDVGGVITDVRDAQGLDDAWNTLHRNVQKNAPSARISGIELQQQIEDHIEAFTGFVSDPRLGATVGVGMGGVLVELIDDVAHALAPVGTVTAEEMIRSTRLGAVLAGYRLLHPATSLAQLSDVLCRLSWLAADLGTHIAEVDLNPVMIEPGSGRVRMIDALIVARGDSAESPTVSPSASLSMEEGSVPA